MGKVKLESLECALKDIMSYMRMIDGIQDEIREKYGIRLTAEHIGLFGETGQISVRNGIDKIAKELGHEVKISTYSRDRKEFKHYGVEFFQYADDKQKHFTEASEEKPKVEYV